MKPEGKLKAARAVAQHSPELMRAPMGPDELVALLGKAGERLARFLAPALAPMAGGKGVTVKAKPARRSDLDELTMFSPDLAANILLGMGPERAPLLAMLDAAAVLRMVDRTFGGRGEAPSPLPGEFPASAGLFIRRLETMLVQQLGGVLFAGQDGAVEGLARGGSLAALEPFRRTEPVAGMELEVTEPAGDSWLLTLAVPLATLSAVFGEGPRPSPAPRAEADPLDEPFAGLPLQLAAVLVDMKMPMSALAGLEPGMVLPVAVARNVPLKLGRLTVATGTVGAADDRVALQITSAF